MPIRIMPLGDSITAGLGVAPSYRYFLWNKLNTEGYDVDFVGSRTLMSLGETPPYLDFDANHEGYSGYRTFDLIPIVSGLTSAANPDVVIIHIGTNDIGQHRPYPVVLSDIGTIIDNIRIAKQTAKIILSEIIPCNELRVVNYCFPIKTLELNTHLPTLVAAKNTALSPVKLVDQFYEFSEVRHLQDGLHPNAEGEMKMSLKLYDVLLGLISHPAVTKVNNKQYGTGINQFNYVGDWKHKPDFGLCAECSSTEIGIYNIDYSVSDVVNSYAEIKFAGNYVKFYGVKMPYHGIAGVSIDGGSEVMVDMYSAAPFGYSKVWTSPTLSGGVHTLKIRVTGNSNPSSAGSLIAIDRIEFA